EVAAPVVDLRDVRLLDRVLDRQGVEAEDVAHQRLGTAVGVLVGVLDVDPEGPLLVVERVADLLDRPVEMDPAGAVAQDDPDRRPGGGLTLRQGVGMQRGHRDGSRRFEARSPLDLVRRASIASVSRSRSIGAGSGGILRRIGLMKPWNMPVYSGRSGAP